MAVLHAKTGVIYYMDSLLSTPSRRNGVLDAISDLMQLYENTTSSRRTFSGDMNIIQVQTPQQKNNFDCGIFLILNLQMIWGGKKSDAVITKIGKSTKSKVMKNAFTVKMATQHRPLMIKVLTDEIGFSETATLAVDDIEVLSQQYYTEAGAPGLRRTRTRQPASKKRTT